MGTYIDINGRVHRAHRTTRMYRAWILADDLDTLIGYVVAGLDHAHLWRVHVLNESGSEMRQVEFVHGPKESNHPDDVMHLLDDAEVRQVGDVECVGEPAHVTDDSCLHVECIRLHRRCEVCGDAAMWLHRPYGADRERFLCHDHLRQAQNGRPLREDA